MVFGRNSNNSGVAGESVSSSGVVGTSDTGYGVEAISVDSFALFAAGTGTGQAAVFTGNVGIGAQGQATQFTPGASLEVAGSGAKFSGTIAAETHTDPNVYIGFLTSPRIIFGGSTTREIDNLGGVMRFFRPGVVDMTIDGSGNVGISATLSVAADIILTNADCAEEFDIAAAAEVEPGTVMVLDRHGALQPSQQAYDKKVAGVISGAGDYRPGLILDKKESSEGRLPVALLGKVYCKVDAKYAPVEIGDLLTTSPTLGHAMRADDPAKAFGAVIGKALQPLSSGQGLIAILVTLQ